MKTLVIGYGNPLRTDDGIGPYVANQLKSLDLPDVTIKTCHQLNVELVDDLTAHERVIFVDAGHVVQPFQFRQLKGTEGATGGGSHNMSPGLLCELTRRLSSATPDIYLGTVQGADFGFGEGFSAFALDGANEAIGFIKLLLTKDENHA